MIVIVLKLQSAFSVLIALSADFAQFVTATLLSVLLRSAAFVGPLPAFLFQLLYGVSPSTVFVVLHTAFRIELLSVLLHSVTFAVLQTFIRIELLSVFLP